LQERRHVEPFTIDIPAPVLDDLQQRLRRTRWLSDSDSADTWEDGANPAYLRELVEYWRDAFDWRAQEARLNQFAHFQAAVDGTRVHLIHERGRGPAPLPLLLTHGYPDSFYRFYKLIPLLTDPAAHGGDAADAFDVVAPSLPGYGFSEARTASGATFGIGGLWHELMTKVLGYERFGAHGGDWGSTITEHLARSHGRAVAGIHLTDVPFFHAFRQPDDPTAAERTYFEAIERFQKETGAYAMIQGTRPRTAAPALNDSPAGLAAWIVEKFVEWSDCGGNVETRFTKDELLTNVMIYWVTGTIGSSFQPYRDFMKAGALRWIAEAAKGWAGAKVPAGFAMFPKDLSHPPREWAERFFDVQRWSEMPRGGHFAALEEPELLATEIREFFRPLR
jgi:microsomal epoxide hydrolase